MRVYAMQKQAALPVFTGDSSTTDAAGHFAFKPVAAGGYTVSFQKTGFVNREADIYPAKDTTLRIGLLATGSHAAVRGKVMGTVCPVSPLAIPCVLAPMPKCTVTVSVGPLYYPLDDQIAIYPPFPVAIFTAVTNDSGVYLIDSIPISSNNTRVYVRATKAGFVSQSMDTGLWNITTTMANFTLSPVAGPVPGDSVYTFPAKPTIKDSITYNFFDEDACCCAQFVNPAVLVQDTMVILSFSVNTAPCQVCLCIAAGKWYAFKGGALKAGRYGIYRQENIYCAPGQACPPIAFLPVRIGEVIVSSTAVSSPMPTAPRTEGLALRQEGSTVDMSYSLNRSAHLRVTVFNARGMLVGRLYNGLAGAGMHGFSWKAPAQGVYVMSVEINGTANVSRKIIISQ
jgi:hypothetical protein